MGTPEPQGAAAPRDGPRGPGALRGAGRGDTPAACAPSPAPASGNPGGAPGGRWAAPAFGPRARENLDCESWVREKVLFLLHPERWLGTRGSLAWDEVAGGEDLPQAPRGPRDQEPDGANAIFQEEKRIPGRRLAAPWGAPPPGPAAPRRPVLVRVVDYQATQEVLRTAWTKGRMTTRTEERSIAAVTFRTGGE